MTENEFDDVEARAGELIDVEDLRALDAIATLYKELDPMPDDLIQRVSFGLALDEVFAEVARLTREAAKGVLARGDDVMAPEVTATLTFTSDRLTAMITIASTSDRDARVDGWLDPAERLVVRARHATGQVDVESDDTGRFVFEELPKGFVQLSFRHVGGDEPILVVTPAFEL
jgi:hypothetical protein